MSQIDRTTFNTKAKSYLLTLVATTGSSKWYPGYYYRTSQVQITFVPQTLQQAVMEVWHPINHSTMVTAYTLFFQLENNNAACLFCYVHFSTMIQIKSELQKVIVIALNKSCKSLGISYTYYSLPATKPTVKVFWYWSVGLKQHPELQQQWWSSSLLLGIIPIQTAWAIIRLLKPHTTSWYMWSDLPDSLSFFGMGR